MKALTTLLVVGMFLTTGAMADDVDDVKAAVLGMDAAWNRGDVDAIAAYMHPEHSRFESAQGVLVEGMNADMARTRGIFDANTKVNLRVSHLGVTIHGDTGIATGYAAQTVTLSDGTVNEATVRFSEIWVKEGGKWLRIHIHESPLNPQ